MATLRDYRDERIRKLNELTRLGINPYPSKSKREVEIAEITRSFQQLEGNIMVPLVMSRTLSLSSLYILIVTLVGAALGGALGVLLAIPLASILHIFYTDWMHYRRTSTVSD
jgi:lysyl-tRNA synthetase class II